MPEPITLEQGKIYFISFGNTQLIVRFKEDTTTEYIFYDYIHYWNGNETFYSDRGGKNYCVHTGIEEIRRATKPEKHALIKFEIENDCI